MPAKMGGVIYALTAMGYKSLGPLFDGQEPESRFEVPSMTVAQAMKIFNGKDSKARDDLSDELFYACLDAKIFDLAAEWISKQTIGQLLHNYKGKIDTSYRDRLKHLVNQGLLSVKVENQATYYRACSFSSPPPSPEPARTAEPSLMTPEVAAEAIEVVEPPQVEPIEAIAEVVKPPGANAVADVASDLVLTNQEFYECIQSGKPGKEGQFHYSGWGSLDRSLREVIRKLNAAGLLDNRHEAISKGLASGHPGEWPWSDIEIAFECLTGGSIPGQRKIVNNKPVLVKPKSGSGSRSTPASPPYSNPVKAEVVPVDSVAIVPAPPPVPLAATDEAMDLSGLTPEDLLYNEVKRNYVLRKFDQRAARRILDQVCQSVGRVLPWLKIDGEYYIPTDSVAGLYGVERDSVNVNYNRKLSLFGPITRKFEGQDLVNLRSHLNSLSVTDSESVTLREFGKAVNQARNLIGYTALAVLQMSNISETSMARTINMAIITALSEIFPGMERAAAMGKSQLGQTITNADIADMVYAHFEPLVQNAVNLITDKITFESKTTRDYLDLRFEATLAEAKTEAKRFIDKKFAELQSAIENASSKDSNRRDFSKEVKEQALAVLLDQHEGLCLLAEANEEYVTIVQLNSKSFQIDPELEYHHIDGNKSHNNLENCLPVHKTWHSKYHSTAQETSNLKYKDIQKKWEGGVKRVEMRNKGKQQSLFSALGA